MRVLWERWIRENSFWIPYRSFDTGIYDYNCFYSRPISAGGQNVKWGAEDLPNRSQGAKELHWSGLTEMHVIQDDFWSMRKAQNFSKLIQRDLIKSSKSSAIMFSQKLSSLSLINMKKVEYSIWNWFQICLHSWSCTFLVQEYVKCFCDPNIKQYFTQFELKKQSVE